MDIAREISTDIFYTVNSGLPRAAVTAVQCHFRLSKYFSANIIPQLLVGRVEVHRLQCKNCQYRFLGQYPSKMYDFFFLSSIYQTG